MELFLRATIMQRPLASVVATDLNAVGPESRPAGLPVEWSTYCFKHAFFPRGSLRPSRVATGYFGRAVGLVPREDNRERGEGWIDCSDERDRRRCVPHLTEPTKSMSAICITSSM